MADRSAPRHLTSSSGVGLKLPRPEVSSIRMGVFFAFQTPIFGDRRL